MMCYNYFYTSNNVYTEFYYHIVTSFLETALIDVPKRISIRFEFKLIIIVRKISIILHIRR